MTTFESHAGNLHKDPEIKNIKFYGYKQRKKFLRNYIRTYLAIKDRRYPLFGHYRAHGIFYDKAIVRDRVRKKIASYDTLSTSFRIMFTTSPRFNLRNACSLSLSLVHPFDLMLSVSLFALRRVLENALFSSRKNARRARAHKRRPSSVIILDLIDLNRLTSPMLRHS